MSVTKADARKKFDQFAKTDVFFFTSDKTAFYFRDNALAHAKLLKDKEVVCYTRAEAFSESQESRAKIQDNAGESQESRAKSQDNAGGAEQVQAPVEKLVNVKPASKAKPKSK